MQITIKGVPPYDGSYRCDGPYLVEEIRVFKRLGNILPDGIGDALVAGDVDAVISLAIIGLRRAGQPVIEEILLKSELGKIMLEPSPDEVDAVPPPQMSEPPTTRPSEPTSSSGASGSSDGESQPEKSQNGIGTPALDIGVTSGPVTSAG